MKDLRVTITVKNGALLRVMESKGYDTAIALHRASGVPYQTIINYLGLKLAPYLKDGRLSAPAEALSLALDCVVEELFPAPFLRRCLETNRVTREVSSHDLPSLMGISAPLLSCDPERSALVSEAVNELTAAIADLPPRERIAINMNYGLDGHKSATLDEVGAVLGVSRERVRQIILRGERRLRHPRRDLSVRCAALIDGTAA